MPSGEQWCFTTGAEAFLATRTPVAGVARGSETHWRWREAARHAPTRACPRCGRRRTEKGSRESGPKRIGARSPSFSDAPGGRAFSLSPIGSSSMASSAGRGRTHVRGGFHGWAAALGAQGERRGDWAAKTGGARQSLRDQDSNDGVSHRRPRRRWRGGGACSGRPGRTCQQTPPPPPAPARSRGRGWPPPPRQGARAGRGR